MQSHVRMLRDVDHNFKIYQLEDLDQLLLLGDAEIQEFENQQTSK